MHHLISISDLTDEDLRHLARRGVDFATGRIRRWSRRPGSALGCAASADRRAPSPARSRNESTTQGKRRRAACWAEQHRRVALLRRRPLVLRHGEEPAVGADEEQQVVVVGDRAASRWADDLGALVVSLGESDPGQPLAEGVGIVSFRVRMAMSRQ